MKRSCKTWMLDGWTILAKNLDNSVKMMQFLDYFLNKMDSIL